MQHLIHSGTNRRTAYRVALAAGVLGGVALLAACGDSSTAAANKSATAGSDAAARLVASAGDWRPSEKLTTEIAATPVSGLDDKERAIQEQMKSNHEAWKEYITRRSAFDDLKMAAEVLQKSVAGDTPGDVMAAVVQAQQANIVSMQAGIQLLQLQDSLSDLAVRAAEIQSLAHRVALTGALADTAERRKETNSPAVDRMLGAAKTTLEHAQADATQKQQAAKALDDQITAKRAQAQELYGQSQAAIQKADAGKGQDSVDAYKAALDVKAQADKLTGEVAVLTPQSQAANGDAQVAGIALKEAQESVETLTAASDRAAGRAKSGADEGTALRAQAQAAVNAPAVADGTGAASPVGLTDLVKAFKAECDQIHDNAAKTRALAEDARTKYKTAGSSFSAAVSGSTDPMEHQMQAILQIYQAGADDQAGAASVADWAAANLQKSVAPAVALAYAGAKIDAEAVADPTAKIAEAATNAGNSFKDANAQLDTALNMVQDNSAPKWLAYSLKAVVNDGIALIASDPAARDVAREAAKAAARDAMKRNPALPLGAFTAE